MKKWGLFILEDEVDKTIDMIGEMELEVFETRELTAFEKFSYGYLISAPIWIIMFYGTENDYQTLVMKNELVKVF